MRLPRRLPAWAVTLVLGGTMLFAMGRLGVAVPLVDAATQPAAPIDLLHGIERDSEIRQEFVARAERIEAVSLHLATFARVNEGSVILQLEGEEGGDWRPLGRSKVPSRSIADNQFQVFGFDRPIKVRPSQHLAIRVTSTGDRWNAVALWFTPQRKLKGYALFVNGSAVDGVARFDVAYAPARGRMAGRRLRALIWQRITVLLDPFGKAILVLALLSVVFGTCQLLGDILRDRGPGPR